MTEEEREREREKFQHRKTIKGITEIRKKERRSELVTTDSEERKKRTRDGRWEKNIG